MARAIMDRIDVPPNRVLVIDDHESNVAGAREVGIRGELFPRDGGVAALQPILADTASRCDDSDRYFSWTYAPWRGELLSARIAASRGAAVCGRAHELR
jgi:hypothetical protein